MHVKSDSEVTSSIEASTTPPRSPRRPLYYVQSPSHSQQHDVEKMSYGYSPFASPTHHYQYHCSPIHHSRESSTSRFSASLKNPKTAALAWKRIQSSHGGDEPEENLDDNDDDDDAEDERNNHKAHLRFYVLCFLFCFVLLFSIFSLILWAASVPYKPKIFVKVTYSLSFFPLLLLLKFPLQSPFHPLQPFPPLACTKFRALPFLIF